LRGGIKSSTFSRAFSAWGTVEMDQAVIKALKEKKELQRRLAVVDQFLRLYEQFSEPDQAPVEDRQPVDKTETVTRTVQREPTHGYFVQHGPKAVVTVSRGILQDFGVPLTRGELATELEIRRVRLPGKDKESRARYVGTILWRNPDRFENIEGRGYWLKGVLIPETEDEKKELRKAVI
jgi:hypothetical protein